MMKPLNGSTTQPITIDQLARFLELWAARVAADEERLTALDAATGDADHGANLRRALTAVVSQLPELRTGTANGLLKGAGMLLISNVGGAAGPLYGTFFLRAGAVMGEMTEIEPEHLGGALRAGLNGVMERGRTRLGDKTMVDAISPAVAAIERSAADGTWPAGLGHAAHAAAAGRDRVTPLVARKGLASELGGRSAGHQDPGAASAVLMFEALRDALTSGAGPDLSPA